MNIEQKKLNSMEVAEMVEKSHNELLKDIRRYVFQLGEVNIPHSKYFQETTYQSEQNKTLPCYLVSRIGCEFIASKLTGTKGAIFTDMYITRFHEMEDTIKIGLIENLSPELQAIFSHDKKIQSILEHIGKTENRVENLENNMVIDYGQQLVLKDRVNSAVINSLGGKESYAYSEISKKVFSECNKDFQHYFNVNSRNNTPKIRFQEAVDYLAQWEPCNNTKLEIRNYNAQAELAL